MRGRAIHRTALPQKMYPKGVGATISHRNYDRPNLRYCHKYKNPTYIYRALRTSTLVITESVVLAILNMIVSRGVYQLFAVGSQLVPQAMRRQRRLNCEHLRAKG